MSSIEISTLPEGIKQAVQACADTDGETKALSLLEAVIASEAKGNKENFLENPEQAIAFYTMKRLDDLEENGYDAEKGAQINEDQAEAFRILMPLDEQ